MMRFLLALLALLCVVSTAEAQRKWNGRNIFPDGITFENSDTLTNATNGTFLFGRNDAGTVTLKAADDDATAALTINSGGAAALALDAGGAAAVNVGNTNATSVSVCNSAACDTLSLGTNTDADTISIGDSTDTTAITSALWSITGPGIVSAASYRVTNGSALSASNPTPDKATMQAASFWAVSTASNAVDVDLPAMDAGDVGSVKRFAVTTGHGTQALTVTTGTLTVTTHNTLGTTCEDAQDHIDCLITSTTTASCDTFCAD